MTLRKTFISLVVAVFSLGQGVLSDAQTTNVRIAFNGFGGTAPIYLGQDVGIFKKQNLNLNGIDPVALGRLACEIF